MDVKCFAIHGRASLFFAWFAFLLLSKKNSRHGAMAMLVSLAHRKVIQRISIVHKPSRSSFMSLGDVLKAAPWRNYAMWMEEWNICWVLHGLDSILLLNSSFFGITWESNLFLGASVLLIAYEASWIRRREKRERKRESSSLWLPGGWGYPSVSSLKAVPWKDAVMWVEKLDICWVGYFYPRLGAPLLFKSGFFL